MTKILVIGTTDNQGGAARVGWDIGQEMILRGYDVKYFVGYKKSESKNVYELKKPSILKWLDDHSRFNVTSLFRHFRSYLLANQIDFGSSREILEHPWYKDADIIHLHNLHGNFFKLDTLVQMGREKRIVWTLHDMWPVTGKCAYTQNPQEWSDGYHRCDSLSSYPPSLWDNTKYQWNRKRDIYQMLANTTIVTPSNWLAKVVQQSFLKHLPLEIIHNGVNAHKFRIVKTNNLKKKLGLPENTRIVSFVAQGAQTDPRKGWKYVRNLLDKYSSDHSVHFLIIGDGKSIVKNDNVTIVPFVISKSKLSEYYQASNCLIFTSLAENCPLVVLEAMACGLPVLAFKVGGVPELVKHKINGYISKYKDEDDLKKGLEWVLRMSKKDIASIGRLNRERVIKNFSTKTMVDQYEKLYLRLMKKG